MLKRFKPEVVNLDKIEKLREDKTLYWNGAWNNHPTTAAGKAIVRHSAAAEASYGGRATITIRRPPDAAADDAHNSIAAANINKAFVRNPGGRRCLSDGICSHHCLPGSHKQHYLLVCTWLCPLHATWGLMLHTHACVAAAFLCKAYLFNSCPRMHVIANIDYCALLFVQYVYGNKKLVVEPVYCHRSSIMVALTPMQRYVLLTSTCKIL